MTKKEKIIMIVGSRIPPHKVTRSSVESTHKDFPQRRKNHLNTLPTKDGAQAAPSILLWSCLSHLLMGIRCRMDSPCDKVFVRRRKTVVLQMIFALKSETFSEWSFDTSVVRSTFQV